MERIAVLGCCGSGKSYVSRELSRLLNASLTHLDAVYYDDAWNPLPMETFEAWQRELVAAPRWVIDGNYNTTLHVRLKSADTVIFMDMPTTACLWGLISRQLRHGGGQKSNGIYNRITWGVLRYVMGYRRNMRPRVLAKIDQYGEGVQTITLTSRRQTRRFLHDAAAPMADAGSRDWEYPA